MLDSNYHSARPGLDKPEGGGIRSRHMDRSGKHVHIGSGPNLLAGWINVDLNPVPGLDFALDVRRGLPFENVSLLFAEHFLEHLTLEEGLAFLRECRRVLKPNG